jgi:hypothetical protein
MVPGYKGTFKLSLPKYGTTETVDNALRIFCIRDGRQVLSTHTGWYIYIGRLLVVHDE